MIKKQRKKGFSIIEVMVAVFVIIVGVMAAISLLSAGLRESFDSRDQTVGVLLAQEGAELIRNIRDTNWENGNSAFLNFPSGDCAADVKSAPACPGSSFRLYFNPADYTYTHNSAQGTASKFYRKINITDDLSGGKIVTSEVTWGGSFPPQISSCGSATKCAYTSVTLKEWAN